MDTFQNIGVLFRSKVGKSIVILVFLTILEVLVSTLSMPGLSRGGRITLGLFVLAALFWMTEIIPLYVTSFLLLAGELLFLVPALDREGVLAGKGVFMAPFFSDIILLFMGGLLLAAAGSKYRIDNWFAGVILRFTGGKPSLVLLGLMIAGAILSMWMSNTATTAMMLIIAVAMTRDLPEKSSGFKKALFLGIPFSCNLGGMGTPIGTPPNAIALAFLHKAGIKISFLQWMLATIPLMIVLLFILWLLLLFLYPVPEEALPLSEKTSLPSSWKGKTVILIFAASVASWLFGGLTGISSGMTALFAAIALLSLSILDQKDFRSISWDVLFLVGGGLSLGVALQKSRLDAWVAKILTLDQIGFVSVLLVFILVGSILTTFMSNTATANMLIPLVISLSYPMLPLVAAIALTVSTSMALPVSTPPNAIAYYSGEIKLVEMFRTGVIISIISAGTIALLSLTYWKWLGLY